MKWGLLFIILTLASCSMKSTTNNNVPDNKNGLWIEEQKDGLSAVGTYKNGLKEGDWIFYKGNICVKKLRYSSDRLNGLAQSFFPNGNLKLQMHYENDRINGSVYFYSEKNIHLATYSYVYDKLSEVEFYLAHPDGPPKHRTFIPKL